MTDATEPISLDVLLLPAFAADDFEMKKDLPDEFERWLSTYEFENSASVPGANMPVYYTDDGIGITSTGMGKPEAAATVTAILASRKFDCSSAYFVTVGVAGTPPDVGTLGSVFVADAIVDWDKKHRWAARDGETEEERNSPPRTVLVSTARLRLSPERRTRGDGPRRREIGQAMRFGGFEGVPGSLLGGHRAVGPERSRRNDAL